MISFDFIDLSISFCELICFVCKISVMGKSYPAVSEEYQKAVVKARRKIRALVAEKHCSPLMLRLALVSLSDDD